MKSSEKQHKYTIIRIGMKIPTYSENKSTSIFIHIGLDSGDCQSNYEPCTLLYDNESSAKTL